MDEIAARLEAARKELLDLGLRNPLLNHRSRTKQVKVVDEVSDEIFRLLVGGSRAMTFEPLADEHFEDAETAKRLAAGQAEWAELLGQPDEETDESGLADRHKDDRLQTAMSSRKLQTRLLSIHRDARKELTSRPVDPDGNPLRPGDPWTGPRPGIPYVLAAGGRDIYFESPALTESDPPSVREGVTRRVQLSKVIRDKSKVSRAIQPVLEQRGHQGGRFYVNEHGAMFTPVGRGDGNGLDYIYCGQIDMDAWFPEPALA